MKCFNGQKCGSIPCECEEPAEGTTNPVKPVETAVRESDAEKFWDWVNNRGGIAVWRSVNLSNPGASWSTPAQQEDGTPMPQPTWQADRQPEKVVMDAGCVEVYKGREVKRLRIGIERGSGLSFTLTTAASRRLRAALAAAGEGSYYTFDYDDNDRRIAIVWLPVVLGRLDAYAATKGWVSGGAGRS